MVIRVVVAGETQCETFAHICWVADYLVRQLPNFCWERIEKPVIEWPNWLCKVNQKFKWHHIGSPIVWKELLVKGSKPYYIGGAPEFLEYCHSYYNLDVFISPPKFEGLMKNFSQFAIKMKEDKEITIKPKQQSKASTYVDKPPETDFAVCIYGAGHPLAMQVIFGLFDLSVGDKCITKIYLYDNNCSYEFMESVEHECSFIGTKLAGKVVKYIEKIGSALANCDLLIILEHVPFSPEMAIGDWLKANEDLMLDLAPMLNASASRKIAILFGNLGPACYNATVLMNECSNLRKNIAVATSDLGLDIASTLSEITEIPVRQMFCPPVWGFVGINHLLGVRTTLHKYNTFEPYSRYTKVRNSSLNIGSITPEIRTMEYLMYFNEDLWARIIEKKKNIPDDQIQLNKALAIVYTTKVWLFDHNPNYILNLGIPCDGSFGLKFPGAFSQPARFVEKKWKPASDYLVPKDPNMNIGYLEKMAELVMQMKKGDLPQVIPKLPCGCKTKIHKKKEVWW